MSEQVKRKHTCARGHTQALVQSYSSRKCDESSLAFHAPVDTMQGLCLVMGPMRSITSAKLYLRHEFLSGRFLQEFPAKC